MQGRWLLPVAALVATVIAGLLAERVRPIGTPEPPTVPTPSPDPITFPRDRPRLMPERGGAAEEAATETVDPGPGRPLDRFERAIAVGDGPMMVAEVNAIRHSPLAAAILRCRGGNIDKFRGELRQATGVDVLESVDRVMIADQGLVASGYFDLLRFQSELIGRPYGDGATIYTPDEGEIVFAQVGDDLLLIFSDPTQAEAAIDRIEGRAPSELAPSLTEGGSDLYGPLNDATLRALLGDSPLAPLLDQIDAATVRAAVDEQVALSIDVDSAGAASTEELQRIVLAGLAGLRLEAVREGRADLVDLIRQARVARGEGGLAIDVAVPGEMILGWMGCDAEGRPRASPGPRDPDLD